MPGAVMYYGNWRVKPSGKLPVFLRFVINSSFTPAIMNKFNINSPIENRVYLNHMMYWPKEEYNAFENEVVGHLKKNDGWFENYCKVELKKSEHLYKKGLALKKINWATKTNEKIVEYIKVIVREYRELGGPWYAQYPLDEYFETTIEKKLAEYIKVGDPDFRKYVLIFTDPKEMTEVAEERWKLTLIAKEFIDKNENLDKLSLNADKKLKKHLAKFAYINRGLSTSHAYTYSDMIARLKEIKTQVGEGKSIDNLIYDASENKVKNDYKWAVGEIKPNSDFLHLIKQARHHSYLRNRRVEAFFNADHGASFMYAEIAKRASFNPEWIMEVSLPEVYDFLLKGKKLPNDEEINRRLVDYAMVVEKGNTSLVTDPIKIKELEKHYSVENKEVDIIKGNVACLGGVVRGRAKICLDKSEIGKVNRGDILVAQFTTPDFVPAMEKVVAIVADQGGLSSHAAIVSRELGVPCVIATMNGTRLIHDNDLLEVDAKKGIIKIIERS